MTITKLYSEPELLKISSRAMFNKNFIKDNTSCACYYCNGSFTGKHISEWTDRGRTALCPLCEMDSVIYEDKNLSLNSTLISQLNRRWFSILEAVDLDISK